METDEQLMVAVQAGDERALEALIQRFRRPLFSFLNRRVGESAADDLFQESWLRVVRARDRFDPRRRFSTWLFQIANNLCRDRGRRLVVQRRADETLRAEATTSDPPAGPGAARLDAERLLARLPERLREVLVLRHYHDLGEREIAEILGIPRGTVKSRLHHAVRAARREIEAAPGEALAADAGERETPHPGREGEGADVQAKP